jgi:hypothetical protein
MRRLVVSTALALGALALPAASQASPIIECGSLPTDGVTNITTRNVTCSDAREFAHKFTLRSHYYTGSLTLPGWRTYWVSFHYLGGSRDDVRATRTNHVIHFQIGPYGVSDGRWYGGHGKCSGIPTGQSCYAHDLP